MEPGKPATLLLSRLAGNAAATAESTSARSPLPASYTPYQQMDPPLRSSDFNQIYYDPAEIYYPGVKSDGTTASVRRQQHRLQRSVDAPST